MRPTLPLLAAVIVASVVAGASPAMAEDDVNVFLDSHFDNPSTYDGRGDIDTVGAIYAANGDVVVSLKTRTPVDPSTDPNWILNNTGIIWKIDVDGDGLDDYWVGMVNDGGLLAAVTPPANTTILCSATPSFDNNGYILAVFDRACIGSPAGFQIRAFHRYGWEFSVAEDYAPSDGGYCCVVFAAAAPPPPPPPDPVVQTAGVRSGYWMITDNGQVYAFGDARHFGDEVTTTVKQVDIEPSSSGNGYWILAESGAVQAKGDAQWHGSGLNVLAPGEQASALSATRTGAGYWIFTNLGRVLAFGDAHHFGDMSGVTLNGAVLDSVTTPTGQGYWMVASDGGIFSFGDASFFGSMGGKVLNKPVMSMAPDPDQSGYWLVASDGGIFAFDARFYGSMGSIPLNRPVTGMVPGSAGYLMVAEDGGIFAFGNVAFHGSLGSNPPTRPVVAVALIP